MSKDLSKLNLDHLIEKAITPAFLEKLATTAIEQIKRRARLGYSVASEGANQSKFDSLAESTKAKRKRLKKRGKLSSETSPSKSNLTESGQLLDSLEFRIKGKAVEVFIGGERNRKVSSYVSKARPWLNLSKAEMTMLLDLIEEAIDKQIKSN
ncbi:MAG: hypothetical protein ACOH5I_21925 [Oligoflexus sp.]